MANMDFYEERIKELARQAEERARRGKKIARALKLKAKGSFDEAAKLFEEGCSLRDVIPADYRNWFIVLRKMNARDLKAGEYGSVIERVRTMMQVDAERDQAMRRDHEETWERRVPEDYFAKSRNLKIGDVRAMLKAAVAVRDRSAEQVARDHIEEFESDRASVMAGWRLEKQCEAINVELRELELEVSGRVELCALDHFRREGYDGVACEGDAIFTLLDALTLKVQCAVNPHQRADNLLPGSFPAFLEWSVRNPPNEAAWKKIEHAILNTKCDEFAQNLDQLCANVVHSCGDLEDKPGYLGFAREPLLALENALERRSLVAIAKKTLEDPYTFRNGWPDLTLVRGGEVRFIEVKHNDSLIASQLTTIPAMVPLLDASFEVLRIRDSSK